jgi:hypothetical protein
MKKPFIIHQIRNIFAVAGILSLAYATYLMVPVSTKTQNANAAISDNVSGFVWSETIGWISLNSTSDGSTTSYGVNISPLTGTGVFEGEAWSENIGWISFAAGDLSICPSASVASVDWSTGKVTGWARALAGSPGSGWDGCIKFSDDSNTFWNGSGVKISLTDGKFSGYAWGGDVVGWIDFAPVVAAANDPAVITGTACANGAINPAACTQCPNGNIYDVGTSQCIPCGGSGCSGIGGTTSDPLPVTLVCSGGTLSPPYCSSCPEGEAYDISTSQCIPCSGGCTGSGNYPSGGDAICSNGNSNPPACDTAYVTDDGICSLGEPLTSQDCKPTTKWWQF